MPEPWHFDLLSFFIGAGSAVIFIVWALRQ